MIYTMTIKNTGEKKDLEYIGTYKSGAIEAIFYKDEKGAYYTKLNNSTVLKYNHGEPFGYYCPPC